MKMMNNNCRRYRIASALSLVAAVLLAGCDQAPKNDLEQWIDANAVQPFQRIEVPGRGDGIFSENGELRLAVDGSAYTSFYYGPELPRKMPRSWEMFAADLLKRRADFERRYGKNKVHLVPLGKTAPEMAQRIGAAVKSIGLAGDGTSYLVISRLRCLDATGLSAWVASSFSQTIESWSANNSWTADADREEKALDPKERELVRELVMAWMLSWVVDEGAHMDVTLCHQAFTPAYRVSVFYVEGSRGYRIPADQIKLDDPWVESRLGSAEGCGFDPEQHAVPDWVREACRERQLVSLESDEGLALSWNSHPWVYTQAGLKLLSANLALKEKFRHEHISTVHVVVEEK